MSDYTKSTNFATKDNLTPGDPLKIVRGTEIDTEFNNIATAIATKTDNASAAITGGSITGITDLAIADGGTGASTATAAINNLLPSQTSNANKYLQTDGTNVSWDAVTLSTADITGTLPVANGGTGVTSSTGTGSVVLSNSPTLVTPALGTPASGVATNITGLPISTGVSGLGTGVATALAVNVGSAGAPLVNGGVLGTPSSGTATNLTGLPLTTGVTGTLPIANGGTGQTTANAAFNALAPSQATASGKYLKSDGTNTSWDALDISTADITGTLPVANGGTGVTTSTGTGSVVLSNSPTLVTPALGTPSSATLTNATGLPISTGVSGLGTGVATALAVNVGSAGAPVVNGGALGTPSSGTVTNLTGTASININGTVGATTPTTGAFTTTTVSTSETLSYGTANGVTYLNGSKVLTSGSALTFDGATLTAKSVLLISDSQSYFGDNGVIGGGAADGNTTIRYFNGKYLAFKEGTSELMRLTSTGLGIGTSSAGAKLSVVNAISAGNIGTSFQQEIVNNNGAGVGDWSGTIYRWLPNNANTNQAYIGAVITSNSGDTLSDLVFGVKNSTTGNTIVEAMRIKQGNVGIGTSSPAAKLDVQSSGSLMLNLNSTANTPYMQFNHSGTAKFYIGESSQVGGGAGFYDIYAVNGLGLRFYTNGVKAATIDTAGNLGLGVTPSASWANYKVLQIGEQGVISGYASGAGVLNTGANFYWDGSGYRYLTANPASMYQQNAGAHNWRIAASGTAGDAISFTQAMTLDASGNLRIGLTGVAYNTERITVYKSGNVESAAFVNDAGVNNYTVAVSNRATTGDNKFMVFATESSDTTRGTIAYNRGTGLVVYSTTSDYRAKDIIGPVENPGAVIDAVPVYMGKMKGATQERPMFIAHETPAYAHTGEKDAVDADGNPVYQQMDASALIPVMWAEIQSLRQRLAAANL